MTPREKPVCRYCGSTNIAADAFAAWDDEEEAWTLRGVLDGGHCIDCGKDNKRFNWIKVETPT